MKSIVSEFRSKGFYRRAIAKRNAKDVCLDLYRVNDYIADLLWHMLLREAVPQGASQRH